MIKQIKEWLFGKEESKPTYPQVKCYKKESVVIVEHVYLDEKDRYNPVKKDYHLMADPKVRHDNTWFTWWIVKEYKDELTECSIDEAFKYPDHIHKSFKERIMPILYGKR